MGQRSLQAEAVRLHATERDHVDLRSTRQSAELGAHALAGQADPIADELGRKEIALDDLTGRENPGDHEHGHHLAELRDVHEEAPLEVEASEHSLNYIKLDGNVGCMVNGAGLAMATMDLIKLAGGEPANFLDVGGGANPKTVEAGFRIILKDPHVKAILVNIFGGIVRCDQVALGVVEAAHNVEINMPLIVRLQGTNADLGKQILDESDLEIETAILFQEAAQKVTEALHA